MIDRKAALVGCRVGQWVRTNGMRGLKLNAKVHESVVLRVHQFSDSAVDIRELGAGIHQLDQAAWTRVEIIDGPHADALCLLETS